MIDTGAYSAGAPPIRGLRVADSTMTSDGVEGEGPTIWEFPNEATVTEIDPNTSTITWEHTFHGVPEITRVLTLRRPIRQPA